MPDDYTAEFRQQVLRRIAECNDLDAVAREFRIPSDVLFGWLRDAVDDGRRLGASTPAKTHAVASGAAATPSEIDSGTGSNRGMFAVLSVFVCSGVFFFLTGLTLGFAVASHAFQGVMVTAGTVIGLGVFVWLMRGLAQDVEGDEDGLQIPKLVLMAGVVGSVCGVSVWLWTLALPSYPHRFLRQPAEVRTTVVRMAVWNRKGGICPQITTAVFDTRFPAQEFCIDRQQYNGVRIGETVVLRGSVSWFGFKRDSVVFIPPGA